MPILNRSLLHSIYLPTLPLFKNKSHHPLSLFPSVIKSGLTMRGWVLRIKARVKLIPFINLCIRNTSRGPEYFKCIAFCRGVSGVYVSLNRVREYKFCGERSWSGLAKHSWDWHHETEERTNEGDEVAKIFILQLTKTYSCTAHWT